MPVIAVLLGSLIFVISPYSFGQSSSPVNACLNLYGKASDQFAVLSSQKLQEFYDNTRTNPKLAMFGFYSDLDEKRRAFSELNENVKAAHYLQIEVLSGDGQKLQSLLKAIKEYDPKRFVNLNTQELVFILKSKMDEGWFCQNTLKLPFSIVRQVFKDLDKKYPNIIVKAENATFGPRASFSGPGQRRLL